MTFSPSAEAETPVLAWTARYNGSANNVDVGQKVATDTSGNVYVTGWSHNGTTFDYTAVKYDANGNQLWASAYDHGAGDFGQALAVDGSGNVYVTGRSMTSLSDQTDDIATIKYDTNGNQLWVQRYGAAGRSDVGLAIAVGNSGNVYVTGVSNNGTNDDLVTLAYDTNGNQLWMSPYNNGHNDSGRDVKVVTGYVYVVGWSEDNAGIRDYITIKYDATNGNQLWGVRYNGSANNVDVGQKVATDTSGNVYVTGWSHNGTTFDYTTVKYDANGNQLWASAYDHGAGDFGQALAVDGSGNVYVTGRSMTSLSDQTDDIATIKYDTNGNQLWVQRYGAAGRSDVGLAIAVGNSGNVYVTGVSNNGTNDDLVTLAYDTNGNQRWVHGYNNGGDDSGRDIALDTTGNVIVVGWSNNASNGLRDYVTIKYLDVDLVIDAINGQPDSQAVYGTITLSYTVRNKGGTTGSNFSVGMYLSSNSTLNVAFPDRVIATVFFPSLAGGQSYTGTVTSIQLQPPTNYTWYLKAMADGWTSLCDLSTDGCVWSGPSIHETDESNNVSVGNTITVTP